VVAITACATTPVEPKWGPPKIVPRGWIADYDYTSGLKLYLRRQYDSARLEGATAYIYIYTDLDPHCLRVREFVRDGQIAAAFRDVRITMLNYDRLRWLYPRSAGIAFDPGHHEPSIVKISMDGDLADTIIYPDYYLYHPWRVLPRNMLDQVKPLTLPQLVEKLQQFFQANNEI